MSIDKWSSIDYGKTAHWWLGNEGTACGRDFRQDIRQADIDAPCCRKCVAHLAPAPQTGESAACGRDHPGACAWIGKSGALEPICLQPECPTPTAGDAS